MSLKNYASLEEKFGQTSWQYEVVMREDAILKPSVTQVYTLLDPITLYNPIFFSMNKQNKC